MINDAELLREREYTARVQHLLACAIHKYQSDAKFHDESIKMMLSDAWDELRMKPTALSPQDMMQLSFEINRTLARKSLIGDLSARYEKMLLSPFFGRIDFVEEGLKSPEKIVIGLYSLRDENGVMLVHDWRAPICDLYYNSSLGQVSYSAAMGEIKGRMTLKRQYRMENGRLKYYVDTDVSIDDDLLLDILSSATTRHMRTIVITIQKEQNAAIRLDGVNVMSVTGAAGSGKTSVAMHRAAYLMYQHPDTLDARRIAILSPSGAFSEYVSKVLPELGEENVNSVTQFELVSRVLGKSVQTPLEQSESLLAPGADTSGAEYKSTPEFSRFIEAEIKRYAETGPEFTTIALDKTVLATKEEMRDLYQREFASMTPAKRITRIRAVIDTRLESWTRTLSEQYRKRLLGKYLGGDLDLATNMSVSQRLAPVRRQIRRMLEPDVFAVYHGMLAKKGIAGQTKRVLWEDAPAVAYIMLKLGMAQPDTRIQHLIIDEAQDYSDITLRMIRLYYPSARVTMLGDMNQRTAPCCSLLSANDWNRAMSEPDAPVLTLSKCYRSTLPITRFCNALLPLQSMPGIFGREGDFPMINEYEERELLNRLEQWKSDPSMRIIAVITRCQAQATALAEKIGGVSLLTGEADDSLPDRGVVAGAYHLMKGLEFDAVAVVWPDCELSDLERRRLYTACSRALHALCLFTDKKLIREIGIVV